MAETLGRNISLPIYIDVDGQQTSFYDLVLRKPTVDSVVMSLGDKITGDVYYKNNALAVSMQEYVVYNGVRYSLVNPPTIVREGMASDNGELKGMTKYSFEYYHPMWMLGNFPFCDVAVSSDEKRYLSESKTFNWIGNLKDFVAKLNKNLQNTEWVVVINAAITDQDKLTQLSEVLPFDNNFISDAIKTCYDTWGLPYIVDTLQQGEFFYTNTQNEKIDYYDEGKRFVVIFGEPSNDVMDCTKIIARTTAAAGYYYYDPLLISLKNGQTLAFKDVDISQFVVHLFDEAFNDILFSLETMTYTATQDINVYIGSDLQDATINVWYGNNIETPYVFRFGQGVGLKNNSRTPRNNKIVTRLAGYGSENNIPYGYPQIVWPFTAPDVRAAWNYTVDNDPDNPNSYPIYDGIVGGRYVRLIKHPFTRTHLMPSVYYTSVFNKVNPYLADGSTNPNYDPDTELVDYYDAVGSTYPNQINPLAPSYEIHAFEDIKPELGTDIAIDNVVPLNPDLSPAEDWDDTMDDDGNYVQSYFQVTLPILGFDIYACAAITQEMQINMRSGACIGCTFPVQVDWEEYKQNFYDANGNFDPVIGTGHPRNAQLFPDSTNDSINLIVQKETSTFGTLMPNIYQKPKQGDTFVVLGISLPETYISNAEERLDNAMRTYMQENNVYYFDYPLKFDEHFLATHTNILEQIRPNSIITFAYADAIMKLYVKQLTIKYGDKPLPEYSITLTDNVEVVLNQIGQVAEGLTQLGTKLSELQSLYGKDAVNALLASINEKLSRVYSDSTKGLITFLQGANFGGDAYGINANGEAVLNSVESNGVVTEGIHDSEFVSGDAFSGGKGFGINKSNDGVSNLEVDNLLVRMKAVFTELEIRKLSAVGGNIVLSAAASKLVGVEEGSSSVQYKCYINNDDGTMSTTNSWAAYDIVRCQTFNVEEGTSYNVSNKNYYGFVVSTGEDSVGKFIVIQQELVTGSVGVPEAGDVIVQMGNKVIGNNRSNVIVLETSGSNAPSISQYQGVIGYNLSDYLVTQISPNGNIIRAKSINIQTANDAVVPIAANRGEYNSQTQYAYYDQVSYNGSLWLCIDHNGAIGVTPTTSATGVWLQQVAKGADGSNANTVSCFFDQASFVVPANADGTVDSSFVQHLQYHVYVGGQEVTSSYVGSVSTITNANAMINSPTGEVVLDNFTGDGKCVIELRDSGGSGYILYVTVGFVVIKGGVDALSLHTEDDAFAKVLAHDDPYTAILPLSTNLRLYRGISNISSSASWAIVNAETSGCTANVNVSSDACALTISALTSDNAFVTISATINGLVFKKTISIAVARNGQRGATGAQGEAGPAGPAGADGNDGNDGIACSLSQSSAVVGMDYNDLSQKIKITAIVTKGTEVIPNSELTYNATVDTHCSLTITQGQNGGVTLRQINNFGEGYDFIINVRYNGKTYPMRFRYEVVTVGFKASGVNAEMYARYVDSGNTVHEAKVGTLVENSGQTVVQLAADQIKLEGYTSINERTRIDEQGNLITKNATLEGYLRTSVTANWNITPIGTQNVIIKDNLNIMLPSYANSNVYLPCDPEYVGARVVIIAPTNIKNTHGELIDNQANYLAKIYAGHTYVNHTYKESANYVDDDDLWFDRNRDIYLDKVKAAFGSGAVGESFHNWFIGTKASFDEDKYYCANEIVLQNGMIELLGVPSFTESNMYVTNHKYQLDANGCLVLDSNRNPIQLTEIDANANEHVTLCQWAVVNVQADYIEYNAVNKS